MAKPLDEPLSYTATIDRAIVGFISPLILDCATVVGGTADIYLRNISP